MSTSIDIRALIESVLLLLPINPTVVTYLLIFRRVDGRKRTCDHIRLRILFAPRACDISITRWRACGATHETGSVEFNSSSGGGGGLMLVVVRRPNSAKNKMRALGTAHNCSCAAPFLFRRMAGSGCFAAAEMIMNYMCGGTAFYGGLPFTMHSAHVNYRWQTVRTVHAPMCVLCCTRATTTTTSSTHTHIIRGGRKITLR